ncbi:helix-turn-helix domain-containing protein [Rhodococcus sp. UNC363MFTsu5.1]|uniref:helix-turn-helix domain-containing protein n=1 Tax=Rhodococcus sp. UNC363MFTsu5.1 TaxID=1449069 RepID=UPI00048A1266|nr:helix-turn-helix domain-containing protein [Rhodococcus sp. UNC363MFTsu5.1]
MQDHHSFRIGVSAEAVRLARERAEIADASYRNVIAEAIAVMRAEGLSDRRIAAELDVSKSSIRAMAIGPDVDESAAGQIEALRFGVWVDVAGMSGQHFIIEDDQLVSHERMALHGIGIELLRSAGLADTAAREYLHVTTGQRILVYSQERWKGRPDEAAEDGWDKRGRYRIERCPGLEEGRCADSHTPLLLGEIGLREGDDLFGNGWPGRRPTAHQVWKLLTAAIEETFEIFDPSYPELERRRRPGTTPRYQGRPGNGVSVTDSHRS